MSTSAPAYDAGELGCGAEIVDAIRAHIEALPPGAHLSIVVRDPAAKVDVPALVWLLGHEVARQRPVDERALEFTILVKEKQRR